MFWVISGRHALSNFREGSGIFQKYFQLWEFVRDLIKIQLYNNVRKLPIIKW